MIWIYEFISLSSGAFKTKRQKSGKGLKTPPRTPPQTPPQQMKWFEESIFKTMLMGPRPIVTVLIIKPSVLKRNVLAKLLRGLAFERFQIVGMLLTKLTELEATFLQSAAIRDVSRDHVNIIYLYGRNVFSH